MRLYVCIQNFDGTPSVVRGIIRNVYGCMLAGFGVRKSQDIMIPVLCQVGVEEVRSGWGCGCSGELSRPKKPIES